MGEVVPIAGATPAKPNATEGQNLFTAIVDHFAESGTVLPRSLIAIAVRHGSQALKDGCDQDVVFAGCVQALREGKGRFATDYIGEMAVVKAGLHDTSKDRARKFAQFKNGNDPFASREREMLLRAFENKEEDS